MSERPLLLTSARSGVLLPSPHQTPWWYKAVVVFGIIAVCIGSADVLNRLSHLSLGVGGRSTLAAFAPAAALDDPAVRAALGATSATTTPLVPVRLKVPSLNIDAPVERVGKKADGSMATPSTFQSVAWYAPGSKPGAAGNAVFAGHLNNAISTAGVFVDLAKIKVGARIEVEGAAGRTLAYGVDSVRACPTNDAPLDSIFATSGPSRIVLITCEGDWVQADHSYDQRLVVVAHLLPL